MVNDRIPDARLSIEKKVSTIDDLVGCLKVISSQTFISNRTAIAAFVQNRLDDAVLAKKIRSAKTAKEAYEQAKQYSALEMVVPITRRDELIPSLSLKSEQEVFDLLRKKENRVYIANLLGVQSYKIDKLRECPTKYDLIQVLTQLTYLGEFTRDTFDVILRTAEEIYEFLGEYVIGQEQAMLDVSLIFAKHLRRIRMQKEGKLINSRNLSCLLMGPSGSGKTYMVRKAAEFCQLPFEEIDITLYSSTGYSGLDTSLIPKQLANYCDSLDEAEYGVIFIDEIDKKRRNDTSNDVGGALVQYELLKLIEGKYVELHDLESNMRDLCDGLEEPESLYTGNMLFIFAGAFSEFFAEQKRVMGFGDRRMMDAGTVGVDLKSFGMVPELMRRIPLVSRLKKLTEEDMKNILMYSKNSPFRGIEEEYDYAGVKVSFEEDAAKYIAHEAYKLDLGATSLDTICYQVMRPFEFSLPHLAGKEIVIDADVCRNPTGLLRTLI